MAQTGYTPILIYSSSTTTNAPAVGNLTNSTLGSELAINITDGKLFYKDNTNAIQVIGWKTVPATAGGTGQTVYAVGDILYANTTTSLAKLADVATGNALISGGVGVAPSWGKIGLTTHVSGILPLANGGTNNSTGAATAVTSNSTSGLMQITGPSAASTRVMTTPDANFTVARTDAGQTFTGAQQVNGLFSINTASSGLQTTRSMSFLTTGASVQVINHSTSDGNGDSYMEYGYNGTKIGSITQSGTTGVLYNITSDYRMKTVIGPVADSGPRIDALEPIEYTWNSDGSHTRGFLAHKFQEVYPNSVTGEKDAVDDEGKPVYQNMQAGTSEVIADFAAELKSLRKRVAQLEAKG